MRKTVIKIMPRGYWAIGELESWFSDMAQKGLLLKRIQGNYAVFFRAEPLQMRYRIDISPNVQKSQEQVELYAESGWFFVTNAAEYFIYASLAESNAPELHTDPAEQAFSLNRLLKKSVITAVIFFFLLVLFSVLGFLKPTFSLDFVEGDFIIIFVVAMYSFILYQEFRALTAILKLKRTLTEGKLINHSAPWKKHRTVRITLFSVFIVTLIPIAIFHFISFGNIKTETLPEATNTLPIVRLADIEQNPDLIRGPANIYDNVDNNNYYTYRSSFFAPVQYDAWENGVIASKKWKTDVKTGSKEYSPDIGISMYKLKYTSMNEWVLSGFINRNASTDKKNFTEISNQNFDKLMVYQEKNTIELFAAKGKFVVWVLYNGNADLNTVITAVADKIDG